MRRNTLPQRLEETGHQLTEILYYGDLDFDGLHCVALASQRSIEAGLPPLTPARGLYSALLNCRHRKVAEVSPESARAVCAWLMPPLAHRTAQSLTNGAIIRQEALSFTALQDHLAPENGSLRQQLAYTAGEVLVAAEAGPLGYSRSRRVAGLCAERKLPTVS